MKNYLVATIFIVFSLSFSCISQNAFGQYVFDGNKILEFQKRELNWGANFSTNQEREELRTNGSRAYEELGSRSATFQFKNRVWNFLDFKQEQFDFNFEVGPLWGNGDWIDSTAAAYRVADQNIFGLRTSASASYTNRYYYNDKNYTLVQIKGWARYDFYQQTLEGTGTDSNMVVEPINEKNNEDKFRYGFVARAGWGLGRLNPVNHLMVADYILEKYYPRQLFSQAEVVAFAKEIAKIKHQRNIIKGHDPEKEAGEMQDFLNKKMFLTKIENLEAQWGMGEFMPRFNGRRLEFGPFFEYYNREPDFIYGAYVWFRDAKYVDHNWNRNFSAGINYNRYKQQDWFLAEVDLGWSYFIKLKNQLDFGLKYVPGIAINGFEEVGPLNHGFVPYVGYFTQINAKTRANLSLAWRISNDENLMLPGPDISLSIYRSRY